MNRPLTRLLCLVLLVSACFSLATIIQPRVIQWRSSEASDSVLKVLLGDGRRLFANHFFVQADVSFHSGYYPSIFDRKESGPKDNRHLTTRDEHEGEHADEHGAEPSHSDEKTGEGAPTGEAEHGKGQSEAEAEHEKAMAFLDKPRDWIEAFGRHFMITEHAHLGSGTEREILPWLKISAELDPEQVQTYTVAAFWLRDLGKTKEAEQFLREGLRHNPNSYAILFELGRLYYKNYHDVQRARNVWELALRRWNETEPTKKEPDVLSLDEIAVHLANLEESQTNYTRAMQLLEAARKGSPHADVLDKRIAELRGKAAAQP